MPEYLPAYKQTLPLTLPRLEEELDILRSMHTYAIRHDDVLVLDELFCRIVPFEHRISLWNQNTGPVPRVADSLVILDRALKWAWLAREEEKHVNGMYAGKLREALAVLEELYVFLSSGTTPDELQAEQPQTRGGMTHDEAKALAATISTRLPQAEVEVKEASDPGVWVVEARNPRRGTSQVFASVHQFEDLMQAVRH